MADSTYLVASSLTATAEQTDLDLATALGVTPTGVVENPEFFSGFAARPPIMAAGLLTVADVAATRYFDLSASRGSLDPVVTASGEMVRFEAFSADNGVYARFDLLSEGIDAGDVGFGTTNVDINMPLRTALAGVGRDVLMHLMVGSDAVKVSTLGATHCERKVDLPDRWIRGFGEVPVVQARMREVFTVVGSEAASFLAGLPRAGAGRTVYVAPTPRGLIYAAPTIPRAVRLAGDARIGAARRVSRFITSLTVYEEESGNSAWVFDMPGGRLTLVLTPDPYRGFSGEGGLLADLAGADDGDADAVLECLAWEPTIDPEWVLVTTGLDEKGVASGLASLAASGRVGYDLAAGRYFHRELPYDAERVVKDNPRLAAARKLVQEGAVSVDGGRWKVQSGDHAHWVSLDSETQCTCQWWAKYQGSRGPCSHVLAARIVMDQ